MREFLAALVIKFVFTSFLTIHHLQCNPSGAFTSCDYGASKSFEAKLGTVNALYYHPGSEASFARRHLGIYVTDISISTYNGSDRIKFVYKFMRALLDLHCHIRCVIVNQSPTAVDNTA